ASNRKLGVLQLNTQFYRLPGDFGNPKSYTYPVVISIVEVAIRETVVLGGREGQMALVDAFVKEGTRLMKEENVTCLITSCGFMAATQKELAEGMPSDKLIPIGTSALLQVQCLRELFGGAPDTVGIHSYPGISCENPNYVVQDGEMVTIYDFNTYGAVPLLMVYPDVHWQDIYIVDRQ
ncbi:uncharacterized protein EV420DRAFT_1277178, partial [Desarmillaria tabescens]